MTAGCRDSQQLIEQCQDLVRSLASKIHRNLPPYLELDDLIAYGQVGLAEAARDFDPTRGNRFSTYAYYRIRGAIYDGLSKMTWFSRSQYRKIRYQQMANELLCAEDEEKGKSSGGEIEADLSWLRDISRSLAVVYLATQPGADEETGRVAVSDNSAPPPAVAMDHEINLKLHELIEALPSEASTLIRATYFEGLTLQEAGKRLGISKSWASRLHAKTLQRLARSLRLLGAAS